MSTRAAAKNPKRTFAPDTVGGWMTPGAVTIGAEQTLLAAHEIMRAHEVRHLPVLQAGELVGVISERDLAVVEALPGVRAADVLVEDAMSTDVLTSAPDALLGAVAARMADRKVGSAIVIAEERVLGVLTTVDLLRALADVLASRPDRAPMPGA
jgi:acetoin utilization protein AcuB